MKAPHSRRFRTALLLLLLAISLGGMGWFSTGFPQLAPAWMAALLGTSPGGKAGRAEPGRPGGPADPAPRRGRLPPDGVPDKITDPRIFDPRALPKGLTSSDGEGGSGLNRAVKKHGVWFPVYSPGPHPGSGPPPLTVIPLSIASGTPPPGRVNQTFLYQAEAIGGTPPYTWSTAAPALPGTFFLGPGDGVLSGLSPDPLTTSLSLTVSDAAGTVDTASLSLVIRPARDLAIETVSLPVVPPGVPADAILTASGGVPPYRWDLAGPLPAGLVLEAAHGRLTGTTEETGAFVLVATVTDAQETRAEQNLTLTCREDLDIATPPALPAAVPGTSYHGTFAAAGGMPPYLWSLTGGRLPGPSWKLSPDGILTGMADHSAELVEFTLTVTDAAAATFEKTFRLVVSDLLILVPSREKVGVAWHPAAVSGLLAAAGTGATGFRVLRDGKPVYQGGGSNFVDHGVPSGSTPRYTLIALTADGGQQPIAEKETAVLPQTLTRAQPGTSGDPYADRVVSFRPLATGGYGASSLPRNVTGPPDGRSIYAPAYKPAEVLSLHARPGAGGMIDLEFTDNIVELAPGEDLTIFENVLFIGGNGNQRFMEPAVISVALFPGEWQALPCDVVPPAPGQPLDLRDPFYYARGLAGRNGTTGDDPTNPSRSGGDSFDLDPVAGRAALTWIRYLRIQSTGDQARTDDAGGDPIRHSDDPAFNPLSGTGSSGFDLDAVSAVHY